MASHTSTPTPILTTLTILFIFISPFTPTTADHNLAASSSSFYDVLESHALPIGLFPKGISSFSIDPPTGRFHLHLVYSSPCKAEFETHVRYQCNITGSISFAKIANLSGVAAQELFLWLPVKGIRVDVPSTGLIYFDVGVVFKQFSLSFFETPKECNAITGDEGGDNDDDDVVSFYDRNRGPVVENHSGDFVRNRFTDEERKAVS
ncbi:uncharacterized protein LOC105161227 [Sesamum indicum]|uniref:Uncharacterized protein LOC105161227 n=1 Tax=Sesamum indicum TaxID=4182 RepID=A0A6I9T2I7_SESIN|nr:uncharacterized protein LOC105161227 [Sesamum indicum]